METRRQQKVARSIKEVVSDAILNHLNDPRIECFVSVTKVDISPNLKTVDVYLSIFGGDEKSQKKTFIAVQHAAPKIHFMLAKKLTSKFCPSLHFKMDETLKKTMETLKIINEVAGECEIDESQENENHDQV